MTAWLDFTLVLGPLSICITALLLTWTVYIGDEVPVLSVTQSVNRESKKHLVVAGTLLDIPEQIKLTIALTVSAF